MFTAVASELSGALDAIHRVVPRNSPSEALNLVTIEADGHRLDAIARSNAVSAVASCPCRSSYYSPINLSRDAVKAITATANRDPAATVEIMAVPQRHTRKIELPDKTTMNVHYDEVTVRGPHASFRFEVFHAPPQVATRPTMDRTLVFDPEPLRDMLSLLGDVHTDNEMAYNLTGIHVSPGEWNEGFVRGTAADGRRVAIIEVPCSGDVDWSPTTVIPARLIGAARTVLRDHEGTVEVGFSGNLCGLRVGNAVFSCPLDARPFPAAVSPIRNMAKRGAKVGSIDRLLLKRCLEQARITTSPRQEIVDVTIESAPPLLRFTSASEVGHSVVTPEAHIDRPFKIAIDPGYVIPMLRRLRDDSIAITVDGSMAIQFSTGVFLYLLMGIERR